MSRVYISPSTQDKNIGVNGYGTEENRMNLIADTVVQLLQYNHFEVYRNKPEMTLQEAVADSNRRNVEAHFAIHSNAANGQARGGEIYYKSTNGQKLASAVYKYLEPLTPTADRGVKKHDHLYELNNTDAVAALVEVAFHDNVDDAYFIMTHIQELAECIAHGICDYFGVEIKKPQPKVEVPSYPGLVKKGLVGENVKVVQAQLNALGFSCGKVDGKFGDKTLAAVKAFQKAKGLEVDGKVGPLTWAKLIG